MRRKEEGDVGAQGVVDDPPRHRQNCVLGLEVKKDQL